jgi:hypothetical protein
MTAATNRPSAKRQTSTRRSVRALSIGTGLLAIVTCVVLLEARPSAREVAAPAAQPSAEASHAERDPSVPQARPDRDSLPEELPPTF